MTPKQERFALAVAGGASLSDAYRQAFDTRAMKPETVRKRASELMANGDVTGMVERLKSEACARHAVSVDDLLAELESARVEALAASPAPQCSAAIAATMGKAKLLGLDKQLVEVGGALTVQVVRFADDTTAE